MKKCISLFLAILMLAGMLAMTVSAEGAKQAIVMLPDANDKHLMVTVDEGGDPVYLVTSEAGKATKTGATADNYNVKVEYPAGGTFTVTLKNATLKTGQNQAAIKLGRINFTGYKDITGFDTIIKVEADSTVVGLHKDFANSICGCPAIGGGAGKITITGPGMLTLGAESNMCISTSTHDLIIKDIKIKAEATMNTAWGTRPVIYNKSGNIYIENSELDLYATTGPCIWSSDAYAERIGDKFDITIKNSKIKCVSDLYSTENAIIGCRGKNTVENSELEIISTGAAAKKGIKCFAPKPVLVGVSAIAGNTSDKLEEYNEKKNSTYYYFKCGANVTLPTEPKPTEPTPTTPVDPKPTTPTEPKPTTPNTPDATTPDATTPDVTTPDATTPDVTTPGATTPNATTPNATKPAATNPTTGNNNTTTTPDTDKNDTDKADDKGGIPVILWVVIGVVVAGGIAAAVVVVLKKKKAA